MLPAELSRWSLVELPRLNRAVLAGLLPPDAVAAELIRVVLPSLPDPASLSTRAAKQLLVHLSFSGASVARHYQEADLSRKKAPEHAFDPLRVGAAAVPFRDYFARLAAQTGTGHGQRDSFASVVRWNVPTVEVWWDGDPIAVLPGAFDDGRVRTYTGDQGEARFLELTKKSEALELAVNALLEPISDGAVEIRSTEALRRVRIAVTLLRVLRRLMGDFGALPAGAGLRPEHFIDVFRKFAVHWEFGDVPPSGALDPQALERDLLLGIDFPRYDRHVRQVFPGLLDGERFILTRLMHRAPLPVTLLCSLGLDPAALAELTPAGLTDLVVHQPAVAVWYQLLDAHARASGMHLMLAQKFLFKPTRARERAGQAGSRPVSPPLMSPWKGTTGMDEPLLERLVRARLNHSLAALRGLPPGTVARAGGLAGIDPVAAGDPDRVVRLVRPAGDPPGGDSSGGGAPQQRRPQIMVT